MTRTIAMQHTRGPWTVQKALDKGAHWTVNSHNLECVSTAWLGESDAVFIVRACNAHAGLVSALKTIIEMTGERSKIGAVAKGALAQSSLTLLDSELSVA